MRRRRVVRRAGMKFAIVLLDHTQPVNSRFQHSSDVFEGRMAAGNRGTASRPSGLGYDSEIERNSLGSRRRCIKQIQEAKLLLRGQE
jgi:hypothetical protein